jgi:hypothetical protein
MASANHKVENGVPYICYGEHERSEDCQWEPLLPEPDKIIDLYDTPIDLRPVPKPDPVETCIAYLREHGDHYGVQLLTRMKADEEDVANSQRSR